MNRKFQNNEQFLREALKFLENAKFYPFYPFLLAHDGGTGEKTSWG